MRRFPSVNTGAWLLFIVSVLPNAQAARRNSNSSTPGDGMLGPGASRLTEAVEGIESPRSATAEAGPSDGEIIEPSLHRGVISSQLIDKIDATSPSLHNQASTDQRSPVAESRDRLDLLGHELSVDSGTPPETALGRNFDGIVPLPSGRSMYVRGEDVSQDETTYVILHPLGQDSKSLDRFAKRIGKRGFGRLRVDLHGHGRTPPQHDGAIDYRHNVEDIVALIHRAGLRRVRLVGHSYGGLVAMMLGEHPALSGKLERISAIVPPVQNLVRRAVDEAINNLETHAQLHPIHALAMEWKRLGIPTPWSEFWSGGVEAARRNAQRTVDALSAWGLNYIRAVLGPGAAATVAGMPDDLIAHPPNIPPSVEVQLIVGGIGSMVPPDLLPLVAHFNSDQLANDFLRTLRHRGVNARMIRTKGGSHFVLYERPEEIAQIVTSN